MRKIRVKDSSLWAVALVMALAADSKPNILLIVTDDTGYGDLGAYGGGEGRDWPTPQAARVLFSALKDPLRMVRVRAAQSLAAYPRRGLDGPRAASLDSATREYVESLLARPDTWHAYYNLGNYYLVRGKPREAAESYRAALQIEPRAIIPQVNLAMAHARNGDTGQAVRQLKLALEFEPENAAVNFNLGLLEAEQGRTKEAERHLRTALKADPQMAPAAYNLGLMIFGKQPGEALKLLRRSYELHPNPRYGYTLAYMLRQGGDAKGAAEVLESVTKEWPLYADAYLLWADMLHESGETPAALQILQTALGQQGLSPGDRRRLGVLTARLQKTAR